MGRPSNRAKRRAELTAAFARVLAERGYAGATIAAISAEAGVAPGLVHHHFVDKDDLLESLLQDLIARFRRRIQVLEADAPPLDAYALAAVRLDDTSDVVAARCWVGVLAEAVRSPSLFARVRRLVDTEIDRIRRRSGNRFTAKEAGAVLAWPDRDASSLGYAVRSLRADRPAPAARPLGTQRPTGARHRRVLAGRVGRDRRHARRHDPPLPRRVRAGDP